MPSGTALDLLKRFHHNTMSAFIPSPPKTPFQDLCRDTRLHALEHQVQALRAELDARTGPTIDCRSPEGVAIGLVDGMLAAAQILSTARRTPALLEALRDLQEDPAVRSLLALP